MSIYRLTTCGEIRWLVLRPETKISNAKKYAFCKEVYQPTDVTAMKILFNANYSYIQLNFIQKQDQVSGLVSVKS